MILILGRGGGGSGYVEADPGLLQGEPRGLHRRLVPAVDQVPLLQRGRRSGLLLEPQVSLPFPLPQQDNSSLTR